MNKLEIASIHSYKGRERDLVIFFVDGTYYEYYGRGLPENVLPNDIYVAYTRPKKQLVLLHHHRNPLLPIMPPSKIKATCEIVNPDRLGFSVPYRRRGISTGIRIPSECVRVADILKNIAPHDLFHVLGRIQIQRIHRKAGPISKPKDVMTKHDGRELYEPVDDFVRTATIASFEHVKTGRCTSLGYGLGEKEVPAIPGTPKQRARWFATEAIKYDSERHNYMARKLQMDGNKCDWLRKVLPQTDVRLGKHIGNTPSEFSFGRQVSTRVDVDGKVLSLGGPIDIVQQPLDGCPPILHEIKFDLKLPREAHLQVAIYGYVWAVTHGMSELPEMKVFNIRNGETWEVRSTIEAVKEIIQHLARKKYGYGNKMSDPEFLAECNEIKGKADSLLGSSIPNKYKLQLYVFLTEVDLTNKDGGTASLRDWSLTVPHLFHPATLIPEITLLSSFQLLSGDRGSLDHSSAFHSVQALLLSFEDVDSHFIPAENAPIAHKLNSKQSFIVQHAKDYNLCVSAVPGSGKTTVAVAIMEGDPYRKTLIVTYSKLLQMETLDKATKRGLGRNSPIFTIHALAGKLAGETIMDDKTLESFLRRIESAPFTPKYRLDFDQIIVDEAQDLRLPHYRFTVALYNMVKEATRKSPRLIVMGDPKQAIYDYDGGDSRYLTHADTILKDVTPYNWKRVEMTETHRFGVPSAEFVNIQSDPRTVILGSLAAPNSHPRPYPKGEYANNKTGQYTRFKAPYSNIGTA
ncbi:hypothetical protein FRC16_002443 [Serendipita sp. 398]|nr:hypothetical protein FRC16_002443 [Serendipita sp. 398]